MRRRLLRLAQSMRWIVKCDQAMAKMKQELDLKFAELSSRSDENVNAIGKELKEAVQKLQTETEEHYKVFEKQVVDDIQKNQSNLTQTVTTLADACEKRFGNIEKGVKDQEAVIQTLSSKYEGQLQAWGTKLMEQIAQGQRDSRPKRRHVDQSDPEADGSVRMEDADTSHHRGGMPTVVGSAIGEAELQLPHLNMDQFFAQLGEQVLSNCVRGLHEGDEAKVLA